MVIRYTGNDSSDLNGNLIAQDPSTGEAFNLVKGTTVLWAAASSDGRWVAFETSWPSCELRVTNGVDEPQLLATLCAGDSDTTDWAWSPTGSRLATVEGNRLIIIDPATGDRTDLGQAAGGVTSLAWSPNGTQIAYADGNSPDGSVYVVSINGGKHALIAESIGEVPGSADGSGIAWSPDGTRIAVVADARDATSLYVMNADGSRRQRLAEGVFFASLGSPNIVWSPDGTRIAYAASGAHGSYQIRSVSADGSTSVLVFGPTSDHAGIPAVGGPIWSPDGTQIAFRHDNLSGQRSYLIANADGTGDIHEIDELQILGWRGGWYFVEWYGW
jgi:Tol biopolymer transport system component